MALTYLVHRFFFRFSDFFHHWYMDASKSFFHSFISFLERLDKTFAVGINLRFFLEPLYKDYSIIGRFLGIIFRSLRVLIGITIYSLVFLVFFAAYIIWFAIPLLLIYEIFINLPWRIEV